MFKVLSLVPKSRIERFGVRIPEGIQMSYIDIPYTDKELIEKGKDCDCIFATSVDPVSRNVIENLTNLKLIHAEGVGFSNIDIEAASERKIPVCNNRAVNAFPVAEQALAMMIMSLRHLVNADKEIKEGHYSEIQKEYRKKGYKELSSRHVGIVGFGATGRELARLLKVMRCQVSYYDSNRPTEEVEKEYNVNFLEYDELCKECNIISYHLPSTPSTRNMGDMKHFKMMQKETILLNLARGEIINQKDLADALEQDVIAGAALDVIDPEPPTKDHPLLNMSEKASKKIIFSPHIAGTNDEAFERMQEWAYQNMLRVMNGEKPKNIVNKIN